MESFQDDIKFKYFLIRIRPLINKFLQNLVINKKGLPFCLILPVINKLSVDQRSPDNLSILIGCGFTNKNK